MIQYACISEVWGTNELDSSQRKKKHGSSSSGVSNSKKETHRTKKEPLCDLYQGHVDNIMDAYLTDYPFDKYARVTKVASEDDDATTVRRHCNREQGSRGPLVVEPENHFYDLTKKSGEGAVPENDPGYFPYDSYYEQDTDILKKQYPVEEQAVTTVWQETDRPVIAEEPGLMSDEDDYPRPTKRNQNSNTWDLVAYVASGILLIFIMEQFLRVGLYMRVN